MDERYFLEPTEEEVEEIEVITEVKITEETAFNKASAERKLYDGIQKFWRFKNNLGASVVKHRGSYGSDDGLWELGVLQFTPKDGEKTEWHLTYSTPITDDVLGYLSESQVEEVLEKIKNL
mgnify:CR=1 FL=1